MGKGGEEGQQQHIGGRTGALGGLQVERGGRAAGSS